MTDPHQARVAEVARQVRELGPGGATYVDKGGVHHVVPVPDGDDRFRGQRIDASSLNHILEIDPEGRVCVAEPGVTFAEVVEATLPFGLIPGLVPELEGITLGGAVAGCSVESSSYRVGGFHDTCLEYEVITGTGEVITCSPEQEPFLFGMIHGSYGTLGVLTKITFRLEPATRFVHVEYERYPNARSFHRAALEACDGSDATYIDGIVHSPWEWVLCRGTFIEDTDRTHSYRWLDVYYKSTRRRRHDVLATPDYLFRYDTEAHWLSRTVPPLEWMPVRFLLGKAFLGSTNMIRWADRLAPVFRRIRRRPDVVCDYFIPAERCPEFYDWYVREMDYFPLWVVPYRFPDVYPWISEEHGQRFGGDLFMDLAVYGMPNGDPSVDRSEVLEEKAFELGGIKTLISRNHYTPERFWSIYHRANYQKAKALLDPSRVFRDVYEKLHRVG